jgi:hypothetical protein
MIIGITDLITLAKSSWLFPYALIEELTSDEEERKQLIDEVTRFGLVCKEEYIRVLPGDNIHPAELHWNFK